MCFIQRWACLKIFTRRVYAQAYAFLGTRNFRRFYAQALLGTQTLGVFMLRRFQAPPSLGVFMLRRFQARSSPGVFMLRRFYAQAFLCLGDFRHMPFYAPCLGYCQAHSISSHIDWVLLHNFEVKGPVSSIEVLNHKISRMVIQEPVTVKNREPIF